MGIASIGPTSKAISTRSIPCVTSAPKTCSLLAPRLRREDILLTSYLVYQYSLNRNVWLVYGCKTTRTIIPDVAVQIRARATNGTPNEGGITICVDITCCTA